MTVGIYIRVSTEEQVKEGFSISAQREKLKAFCLVHDFDDYKFYVDEGISAKDMERSQLKLMIDHIKQGMITTVLVYRLDRLTRSVLDLYKLLGIFEEYDCKFKSATEVYDTTTAMGRMFITLVAAIAQWERENLGERVRMGQIEKARQGKYSAKAPFGFDKNNEDVLVINSDEQQIILDMIDKVEKGYSIRQLSNYLDNTGIPPIRGYQWHMASILSILKNPAIYGAVKWRDEIIENAHTGIITKKQYDHLTALLGERQNKKIRKVNSFFVYQMKLICPTCGNHLTSERYKYTRKKDGSLYEHNRYRCQACALNKRKAISVSEKKVDTAFIEYMKSLKFDTVPEETDESGIEKNRIIKQINQIKRQREKYQKAWSVDNMTDEEFNIQMKETKIGLEELEKELEKIQPIEKVDTDKVKEIVNNFNLNWSSLLPEEKHQFLNMFIKNVNFIKQGENLEITRVELY